jgi:hypothetical protein
MNRDNRPRLSAIFIVSMIAATLGLWCGWTSFDTVRTQWIEEKVKNALNQSMQSLAETLPPIQVEGTGSTEKYYAPNVHDPKPAFDLYRQVIVLLNQDVSVPAIKLILVSIQSEFGVSDITLTGQATLNFPLIAGFDKEIIVRSSVQAPHFLTLN